MARILKKIPDFKLPKYKMKEVGDLEEYITNPSVPGNGSATLGNFALAEKMLHQ